MNEGNKENGEIRRGVFVSGVKMSSRTQHVGICGSECQTEGGGRAGGQNYGRLVLSHYLILLALFLVSMIKIKNSCKLYPYAELHIYIEKLHLSILKTKFHQNWHEVTIFIEDGRVPSMMLKE